MKEYNPQQAWIVYLTFVIIGILAAIVLLALNGD